VFDATRAPRLEAIASLVERMLPDSAVDDVTLRSTGATSAVFAVMRTAPHPPVVVKVYDEQYEWKRAKEAHVYGLLARLPDVPAPAVLFTRSGQEPAAPSFTILSMLDGAPLSTTGHVLCADDWREVYRQIGSILAAMHAVRTSGFGYLTTHVLDAVPTNTAYMTRQFMTKLGDFSRLYELYHALELWVWFASLSRTEALDDLEQTMGRLTS
jgi:hypothetical protein